jgi:CheY-like chemotaxis protein
MVEVGVDLVELHKNNAILTFHVTDTGIGIPLELQDKVFDRFFRVTPSYKGIYTGHGVGLHIAQSYAHLLGGDIRLSSEPNVGTSFYFDLTLTIASDALLLNDKPHQDTQSSPTKTADEPHPLSSIITSTLNAPTLLLVEDNAIALKLLECLVSNMGLNHVSAMDGETALQLATEQVFDLIITDLGLPALSGMGFTQQLRLFERTHHRTRVPVVGLTAHADEAVKQECVAAGMDEIYSKPMTTSCLSQITDTYLSSETQIVVASKETPLALKEHTLGFELPETEAQLFDLDAYPLLDVQSVLPGMNNDANLLNNIIKAMRDSELPKDLADIQCAYEAGDWDWVEKTAHRMKGGLVYCGTSRLAYACQYLERYRKAGHTRCLEDLYHQLRRVADDTLETLNRWVLMMG